MFSNEIKQKVIIFFSHFIILSACTKKNYTNINKTVLLESESQIAESVDKTDSLLSLWRSV